LNAVDCPPVSEVEVGLRATVTVGASAMVAVALLLGSATLVAVKVMFCEVLSEAGTVYTPLEFRLPTAGEDQVTAVFEVPVTEALKEADWPFVSEIQFGTTEIATGADRLTVAVIRVPLKLEAVTVTVLMLDNVAGAVYRPDAPIWPA
jgi:hypothetical protein